MSKSWPSWVFKGRVQGKLNCLLSARAAAVSQQTGPGFAAFSQPREPAVHIPVTEPVSTQRGFCFSGLRQQHSASDNHEEAQDVADKGGEGGDSFLDSITATSGPAEIYKDCRLQGNYKKDVRQELTIQKLQALYEELQKTFKDKRRRSGLTLVDHTETSKGRESWWSGISGFMSDRKSEGAKAPKIKGLYMFGGVGTGKTMLMDLLVRSAPPQFKLRRTHFHDFMLEIHSMLNKVRGQKDPLFQVANQAAEGTRVLCLDELFVTDVADAAILNRLFSRLWELGVVLVATSNRHPDDLYKNGLQRELFLPFIEKLKQETEVHDMNSATDYRKLAHHRKGLSFTSEDSKDPDADLTNHFSELVSASGGKAEPRNIEVQMGRRLSVPLAGLDMCLMTFEELCHNNLGAADYIALAKSFHTVALRGVPIFTSNLKSEAYRFVTLIDVLYENRIQLMCSAQGSPFDLFQNILSQQEAKSSKSSGANESDLIVDDNLAFSKDRTISRLTEMGTREYLLSHARRYAPHHVMALDEENKASTRDRHRRETEQRIAAAA